MIVTRKAAVGFILLAVIVFLTAQYTIDQIQVQTSIVSVQGKITSVPQILNAPAVQETQYHPPIVALGQDAALVITAVIEIFALVCYLILKRLEPRIIAALEQDAERRRAIAERERD